MTLEGDTRPTGAVRPRRTLRDWLTRNPVMLKELRGRMRGARAFIVLVVYLFLMSSFVTLLYALYVSAAETSYGYGGPERQWVGKVVFAAVVGIELLLVCFIAPAFTVGAISGERERQTYDLLRTTLLTARSLVWGKLVSAFSYILLLLVAALPLQSLAFLLGGVAPEEVAVATVMLLAAAFLYSAAGLFFSAMMRRTLGATILTYAFVLFDTLALPIMLIPISMISAIWSSASTTPPMWVQAGLIYLFGLLVATNPLAAAVTTEIVLVSEQKLLYFTVPLYDNAAGVTIQLPMVSPWLPLALFSLVLGGLLILFSVLAVKRAEG